MDEFGALIVYFRRKRVLFVATVLPLWRCIIHDRTLECARATLAIKVRASAAADGRKWARAPATGFAGRARRVYFGRMSAFARARARAQRHTGFERPNRPNSPLAPTSSAPTSERRIDLAAAAAAVARSLIRRSERARTGSGRTCASHRRIKLRRRFNCRERARDAQPLGATRVDEWQLETRQGQSNAHHMR